jgi:hypothetical protein
MRDAYCQLKATIQTAFDGGQAVAEPERPRRRRPSASDLINQTDLYNARDL